MKKLFFLIALFSFQVGLPQASLQVPAAIEDFKIESPVVQEVYANLVNRAAEHGKDLPATLKERIVSVEVVPIIPCEGHAPHPEGDLGMVIPGDKFVVVLSNIAVKDTISLEWHLAHELGHTIGLAHISEPLEDGTFKWEAEIMSGGGASDPTHLLYQIMNHPDYSYDIWERFFDQPQFVDLK